MPMRKPFPSLLSIFATVVVLLQAGCDKDPMADGLDDRVDCFACHGDDFHYAPPISLNDNVRDFQVGAHTAHLQDNDIRWALRCNECHLVPTVVEQEDHVDPYPAEVTFGPLATTEELKPVWDRATGRCRDTYCHGGTQTGGLATEPIWNVADSGVSECDSCHGNPPEDADHEDERVADYDDCYPCHKVTVKEDNEIDVDTGQHINGVSQGEVIITP
jgi:predicted CxxxxCH...CXXCH cytochrome family protein